MHGKIKIVDNSLIGISSTFSILTYIFYVWNSNIFLRSDPPLPVDNASPPQKNCSEANWVKERRIPVCIIHLNDDILHDLRKFE